MRDKISSLNHQTVTTLWTYLFLSVAKRKPYKTIYYNICFFTKFVKLFQYIESTRYRKVEVDAITDMTPRRLQTRNFLESFVKIHSIASYL